MEDLENLVDRQRFSMALYVNQNTCNFQMMRSNTMLHVFISHGESDKSYMVSGQTKTYDYCSSPAGGRRPTGREPHQLRRGRKTIRIGRPQPGHATGDDPRPRCPKMTRLSCCTPTTEGDRPACGIRRWPSHGVAMVQALLALDPPLRDFPSARPHGTCSERREQIDAMIATNITDPSAGHLSDQDTTRPSTGNGYGRRTCASPTMSVPWSSTG